MKNKLVKMFAVMLCLVFVFSCTVFAADSPDTGNMTNSPSTDDLINSPDTSDVVDDNNNTNNNNTDNNNTNNNTDNNNAGSDNKADAEEVLGSYAEGVTAAKVLFNGVELEATISSVKKAVVEDAVANAKTLVGANAAVLKVFDLSLPEGDYSAGVDVTMNVPGVVAGQKLAVLHQKADGTWESLPVVKVENGTVTATFTSFSPVAIVSYAEAPSTGSRTPVAVIGMMILAIIVAGAGVVASSKLKTE